MSELAKFLLVEDNDLDARAVFRAFQKDDFCSQIDHAWDGAEALEKLDRVDNSYEQPYIVLLDLNMPRMNGIEFLDRLRGNARLKRSIVFVLTTSKNDEDKCAAYDRMVAGYLLKEDVGRSPEKFTNVLRSYLEAVEFPPNQ